MSDGLREKLEEISRQHNVSQEQLVQKVAEVAQLLVDGFQKLGEAVAKAMAGVQGLQDALKIAPSDDVADLHFIDDQRYCPECDAETECDDKWHDDGTTGKPYQLLYCTKCNWCKPLV